MQQQTQVLQNKFVLWHKMKILIVTVNLLIIFCHLWDALQT